MVKLLKKTTFEEFYKVNEMVAKTTPMSTHYRSKNIFERRLWDKKKRTIKDFLEGLEIKNIIDLGCGDAGLTDVVDKHINYTGIDISPTQLKNAKKYIRRNGRKNARVYKDDILNLKNRNGEFDAALLCDVVEHVIDPEKLFKEAKRIVKKGGYIILSIPNEPLWQLARTLLLRFPPRSPDHLSAIFPSDIENNFSKVLRKTFIPIGFSSKLSLIRIFLVKNV